MSPAAREPDTRGIGLAPLSGGMVLSDALLWPLGLAALAALVPLVVLYLVRPDPERVELPTLRFLVADQGRDSSNPLFERLRRNALLVLQALAVIALALALATPYVSVPRAETVDETVLVVDASASMATQTGPGGERRFDAARAAARESASGTTSVVVAGPEPRIPVRAGTRRAAESALADLSVVDARGDLRAALAGASVVAGENARIVVFSDFADDSAWGDEVAAARARGLVVDLRTFDGGGGANVGIVGRSFAGNAVELTVRNYGDRRADRTLRLGGASRSLDLGPGDVTTVDLPVPAGGGVARLAPGDDFPTDDAAHVAAPADATVDVLLLTNERSRFLTTALELIDAVSLTVRRPPTTVPDGFDVIVYGDVDPDRLLRGNVEAGRDVVAAGGGVAVTAQPDVPVERYGDLLLLEPVGVRTNPTVGAVADDELTRGIGFPPPAEYLAGSLREGRALVRLSDDSPLLAVADRGPGRVLYYGYVDASAPFKFNYQYPVFWKRAVFELAGRATLRESNRATGERLALGAETTVTTPGGTVRARTVALDDAGFYAVGDRRIGVSLYDPVESDVGATGVEREGAAVATARTEERTSPLPLDAPVALVALAVIVGEVAFLRRRGDL